MRASAPWVRRVGGGTVCLNCGGRGGCNDSVVGIEREAGFVILRLGWFGVRSRDLKLGSENGYTVSQAQACIDNNQSINFTAPTLFYLLPPHAPLPRKSAKALISIQVFVVFQTTSRFTVVEKYGVENRD